jgi:predicted nucleic acid-binding protein
MPSKIINVFIDANVIARWIVFNSLLDEKPTPQEKAEFISLSEKRINKHNSKFIDSYKFIEQEVCVKTKKFKFFYSPLVLTEVFNTLFEKYVYEYMKRNFIPLYEIHEVRTEKFKEGTYDQIYLLYQKYLNKLKKFTNVASEKEELMKVSGVFISEYGLLSQDAHILSQAVYVDCNYFVTNDQKILDNIKEAPHIKAMKPASFNSHFAKKK